MILLIGIPVCLFLMFIWYVRAKPLPGIPLNCGSYPIIGSLPMVIKNMHRFHGFVDDQTKASGGKTWQYCKPMEDNIAIVSPENVEYMLKTNFDNYIKGRHFNDAYEEFLGGGIFNSDGPLWKKQRKIASHLFSLRTLRSKMTAAFLEHAQAAVRFLQEGQPASGRPLDMQQLFFQITFDGICDIAFGVHTNTIQNHSPGCDERGVPTGFQLAKDFDQTNVICMKRFQNPFWKLQRLLNLGEEVRLKACIERMNRFVYHIVDENLSQEVDSSRGDILSLFRSKDPSADRTSLRDVVLNFIIAGRDTTGWALTILFYLLATHPGVEEKIRSEIRAEIGEQQPTLALLSKLVYLKAALFEALRLYPSVPYDGKRAVEADVLPDGTKVPAGCIVMYPAYAMGRVKRVWGEDAEQFRPERFLDSEGQFKDKVSDFKFSTFNAGPRLCLGKEMAVLEVRMVTCMLLQRFRFRLLPGHKVEMPPSATFSFAHGMMMTVQPL